MKLIYLFLFSLVYYASAKYLPHERFDNRALRWRHGRSVSDEPDISSDSDDNDEENDESESETTEKEQRYLERLDKEKHKQEKEWRKHEAKIEEEKRKYQERLEKEQRKHQERIEKEKRKQAESQKKLQEKLAKEEKKREEKTRKELEKLEKETFEKEKQTSLTLEDGSSNNKGNVIDIEDLWKDYVYEKYSINSTNTEMERKAALNRYLQEEIGLTANSTKSEKRQAITKVIQTKLQNDLSENSLRSYLLKRLTPADKMNLEAELRGNIEKLDSDATLINNVTLPWIKTAQQQIDEKRTLLQALLQFLSNTVSNWTTEQTTDSGASNSAVTDGTINQINENNSQNSDSTQSNLSTVTAPESNAANPAESEIVLSESTNNDLDPIGASSLLAGETGANNNNQVAGSPTSSGSSDGVTSSHSQIPNINVNSETDNANIEIQNSPTSNNSNSADGLVNNELTDVKPSTETSGVSFTDTFDPNNPEDNLLTPGSLNIGSDSSVSSSNTPTDAPVDNIGNSASISAGETSPTANNAAQENQALNTESIITDSTKPDESTSTILTEPKEETYPSNEKTTDNGISDIFTDTNAEKTNNSDVKTSEPEVSSPSIGDNLAGSYQNSDTKGSLESNNSLLNATNTVSDLQTDNKNPIDPTNSETMVSDLVPSESNNVGSKDKSVLSNDLSNTILPNDVPLSSTDDAIVNDEKLQSDFVTSESPIDSNADIASDSSSTLSFNNSDTTPQQNTKDSSVTSENNVVSGTSELELPSKSGVVSESEPTITSTQGNEQLSTDTISNDLLDVSPSESATETSLKESNGNSILQAGLSIASQDTKESAPVSESATAGWPENVSNTTEINKNNENVSVPYEVEQTTTNEVVADVKEPPTNEFVTEGTDTTSPSTIGYVNIPEESGASVIDIVPQ